MFRDSAVEAGSYVCYCILFTTSALCSAHSCSGHSLFDAEIGQRLFND
jgi:hypothetical protein